MPLLSAWNNNQRACRTMLEKWGGTLLGVLKTNWSGTSQLKREISGKQPRELRWWTCSAHAECRKKMAREWYHVIHVNNGFMRSAQLYPRRHGQMIVTYGIAQTANRLLWTHNLKLYLCMIDNVLINTRNSNLLLIVLISQLSTGGPHFHYGVPIFNIENGHPRSPFSW